MAYKDDELLKRYLMGRGLSFNRYAAGDKQYGARGAPNVGPVANKEGYKERDAGAKAKRNAALRRLKARKGKRFMDPDVLRSL